MVRLRHFVGVTLQAFLHLVHLRASSTAEDNLRHVPAALQDVSDIQDFEDSATNTATSWHRSHKIEIGLGGKGPDEDYRYQEHLAAGHESRCANREVQHRNVLCAGPATIGSDTDEDWSLRQGDTHDTFERDQLVTSLGPFEVGCHAPGECYDARDTDTRRYRLNDSNSEGDSA